MITPIYNAEKYIIETIESVINQTYKKLEYILVDDCSTDNTVNLINDSFRNDSRIKVISSPSNGGAEHWLVNIGLEKASSNYIAFLDSDDLWSPTKLEKANRIYAALIIRQLFTAVIPLLTKKVSQYQAESMLVNM
ncbi:glycosyltransferase family 2 protein [Photobacterium leiognathi]|uniref:glycosyltransferase family 2 protein n=1 Tax=Photobacterium leiognathi TaxID=553611 RepID=UPI0034E5072D